MPPEKLLSCPFQGEDGDRHSVRIYHDKYGYAGECLDCGFALPVSSTEPLAIKRWNTRTPSPELVDTLSLVKECHVAFGVKNEQRKGISFKLLQEELTEFLNAKDDVERLDALLDLQYVLDGTFIAYGFDKIKGEAFKEVHRANMSKLENGKPVFREDGKFLKGKDYLPPQLKQFLDRTAIDAAMKDNNPQKLS